MRSVAIGAAVLLMAGAAMAEEVAVVTTETVPGKTCSLVYHLPAVAQQDIAAVSFKDPTQEAVVKALQDLTQIAARLNANAVLAITVAFTPRTERDTGKVVLTGTLAKCQ
jgi:uncharacterized protein YbjQ (UPF0145 family)